MLLHEATSARRVACTQPRRIAAALLARRLASWTESEVGDLVGFQIGGRRLWGEHTQLVYMTTGVATLLCLHSASQFTHLIVDEVHVRELHTDVLLNVLRNEVLRHDPSRKVIVMSAAMDVDMVRSYFEGFKLGVLDLERHRRHTLTINYLEERLLWNSPQDLKDFLVPRIIREHKTRCQSQDFLVFLPGRGEVAAIAEGLITQAGMAVRRILGGQAVDAQERILQRKLQPSGFRLVILATDVLESSVTIPSVDFIIDTCQHRRRCWDPKLRESPLTKRFISKDEALQRAGRTARVRPGEVLRLVERREFDRFQQHAEPAVRHQPLESMVLQVYGLRNLPVSAEEFLDAMPEAVDKQRLLCAVNRLEELGALGSDRRPTALGQLLEQLPLDPEVGQLVINGLRYGIVEECCRVAAILQFGSPLQPPPSDHDSWTIENHDFPRNMICHSSQTMYFPAKSPYGMPILGGSRLLLPGRSRF